MQPSSQSAPQQIPTIVYQGSPTITSMQVRKEKEVWKITGSLRKIDKILTQCIISRQNSLPMISIGVIV